MIWGSPTPLRDFGVTWFKTASGLPAMPHRSAVDRGDTTRAGQLRSVGRLGREKTRPSRRTGKRIDVALNRIHAMPGLDHEMHGTRADVLESEQYAIDHALGFERQADAETRRWTGLS